jgi:hypothetical protein
VILCAQKLKMRSAHAVDVCAKLKAMPNLWQFTFLVGVVLKGARTSPLLILASFPSREI